MKKLHKITNIALMFTLISTVLRQDLAWSEGTYLRVPAGREETMGRLQKTARDIYNPEQGLIKQALIENEKAYEKLKDRLKTMLIEILEPLEDGVVTVNRLDRLFDPGEKKIYKVLGLIRENRANKHALDNNFEEYAIYRRSGLPEAGVCLPASECLRDALLSLGLSAEIKLMDNVDHVFVKLSGLDGDIAIDLTSGQIIKKNKGHVGIDMLPDYIDEISKHVIAEENILFGKKLDYFIKGEELLMKRFKSEQDYLKENNRPAPKPKIVIENEEMSIIISTGNIDIEKLGKPAVIFEGDLISQVRLSSGEKFNANSTIEQLDVFAGLRMQLEDVLLELIANSLQYRLTKQKKAIHLKVIAYFRSGEDADVIKTISFIIKQKSSSDSDWQELIREKTGFDHKGGSDYLQDFEKRQQESANKQRTKLGLYNIAELMQNNQPVFLRYSRSLIEPYPLVTEFYYELPADKTMLELAEALRRSL